MELELKHLTPYLPYNLSCICHTNYNGGTETKQEVIAIGESYITYRNTCYQCIDVSFDSIKPILHPLLDIKTMFKDDNEWIDEFRAYAGGDWCDIYDDAIDHVEENIYIGVNTLALNYHLMNWFISLHLDVFGLIGSGLAVDINTL